MTDALRLCGVQNVFGDLNEPGPAVDVEAVLARNPDIIIAAAPRGEAAGWLADWKRFPNLRRAIREAHPVRGREAEPAGTQCGGGDGSAVPVDQSLKLLNCSGTSIFAFLRS